MLNYAVSHKSNVRMKMENFDAISLGISIALGILSIGLGIFAIWLSYKFSESSTRALDAVRDLAKETRTLVELNLDQQKSFSGKMLDSILEQNKFGTPKEALSNGSDTVNEVITKTLKEIETKINLSVEKELRGFAENSNKDNKELQRVVNAIKNDISIINDAVPTISSAIKLPESTRNALIKYQDHPAHFVVLAAIVKSNAKCIEDLNKVETQFSLPEGWDSGVFNLISVGILDETNNGFKIPDNTQKPIQTWIEKNRAPLNELVLSYKDRDDGAGVSENEIAIAKKIKF